MSVRTINRDVTYLRHVEKITSLMRVARDPSNFRKNAKGERQSLMLSRSKKVASKSDVSYRDTKVTSEAICRALQGLGCHGVGEFTGKIKHSTCLLVKILQFFSLTTPNFMHECTRIIYKRIIF